MEFYEVLENRHSSRSFLDKEIEPQKLGKVLKATMSAPSAGNLQSYKIYLVNSKDAKAELVAACAYQDFLSQAPTVLVFCADVKRSSTKYEDRGELYAQQDASIAASYCQLAASAEGLSSVWVGAFDPLEVSRIISADPYLVPVAIVPIGYSGEKPEKSTRRPPSEILSEV